MPTREARVQELRARREITLLAQGRRRGRRIRDSARAAWPAGVRLEYQRALIALLRKSAERIRAMVFPLAKQLSERMRAIDPSARQDAPADDIERAMAQVAEEILSENVTEIRGAAETTVRQVTRQNTLHLERIITGSIDVGLPMFEPWMQDFISTATAENTRRIKNLLEQQYNEVENTILMEFRRGTRWETIAQKVRDRLNVAESRAKLIARDQVASLNGELNRLRQTNLGVERYIWRTMGDDSVRPEHAALEGNIYTWAEGSPVGHPGEPIQCRCWAEPVLEDLL